MQNENLSRHSFEQQVEYWQQWLSTAPLALNLAPDRRRPPVQSFLRASESIWLRSEVAVELDDCRSREKIGIFALFLAAGLVLLYQYTGQTNIVIGTLVADSFLDGRRRFTNLIPLHCRVDGQMPVRQFIRSIVDILADTAVNRDVPFDDLLALQKVDGVTNYRSAVQVIMTLIDVPDGVSMAPITRQHLDEAGEYIAQSDLSFLAAPGHHGWRIECNYDAELFEPVTVRRVLEHLCAALKGVIRHLHQRVTDILLLGDEERHQVLYSWNNTQTVYDTSQSVCTLFETQVAKTPHAVAAVCEDESITYLDLSNRANRVAHRLRTLGAGPEVPIGMCVDRSLDLLVALFGILKAGTAYVPLDPTYPQQRLDFIIADTQMQVLLTQQRYVERLARHDVKTFFVNADQNLAEVESTTPSMATDCDSLAYVIYTSGSTGQPKGVQITHRALTNFLLSMRERPGLSADDTLLAITTLSFDIAVLELLLPLIVGARVVIANRAATLDGHQLAALLQTSGATVMQATPTTWKMLLDVGWSGKPELRIFSGGELLPADLANRLLQCGAELWNLYGPTETTVWSATHYVASSDSPAPVGVPICNTQLYVLDCRLQPVPIGVPGEIVIGGEGVSRGYLNRPDLTAEKFVPDLFSKVPGARLYRTGDLARRLHDGTIEFLSRIDHQVKIHGFRIEPAEIEAVLCSQPGVRAALVVVREDISNEKRLVAYVVVDKLVVPKATELRAIVRAALPHYMVPSDFVMLKTLPLTPNGKLDRRALPAPKALTSEEVEPLIVPRTYIEQQIARIWQDVLQESQVGIHDHFFDLGGHSLLLAQVQAQLRELFGIDISTLDLLAYPTVSSLANYVSRQPSNPSTIEISVERSEVLEEGKHRRQTLLRRRRQMKDQRGERE